MNETKIPSFLLHAAASERWKFILCSVFLCLFFGTFVMTFILLKVSINKSLLSHRDQLQLLETDNRVYELTER